MHNKYFCFILKLLLLSYFSFCHSVQPDNFNDSNQDGQVLNVHLVPHTHDDVGWLKTVDQYFFGLNNTIQHACVKSILDTTIRALLENSNRKFTYVEIAFFQKWWNLQTAEMQSVVKDLVKKKQLIFVNGGWCMHDEATTHYMGMIDQTTRGHNFLKDNFDGYSPRIGWQLDPFGHSATQASLMSAEVGFDALFFARIDYEDLKLRQDSKQCEGIWRASPDNMGVNNELFWGLSGSYTGTYSPPKGFNLDGYVSDEPFVDGINIDDRVSDFVEICMKQANMTMGNNIMITMGDDFQYENAIENFERLDALIHYVSLYAKEGKIKQNQLGRFSSINVFYSNPEIYTDAKSVENIDWKVKEDDFFPYADCENCFWTGYFTSRPLLKRYERVASSFLHAARQIEVLGSFHGNREIFRKSKKTLLEEKYLIKSSPSLDSLEDAVSIVQHHDGVSGTSKQHVANDYAFRISQGMNDAIKYVGAMMEDVLGSDIKLSTCENMNISSCEITQSASQEMGTDIFIVAYNALSQSRQEILSIPISIDATYEVLNLKDMKVMDSSLLPSPPRPKTLDSDNVSSPFVLYFDTDILPPVGAASFRIRMISTQGSALNPNIMDSGANCKKTELRGIKDDKQTIEFMHDSIKGIFENGKLKEIHASDSVKENIRVLPFDLEWGYYESFASSKREFIFKDVNEEHVKLHTSSYPRESSNQNSGAYIFRPTTDNQFHVIDPNFDECNEASRKSSSFRSSIHYYHSSLLTEVHTQISPWIHQIMRLKHGASYVEMEYQVGPVPIEDGLGKEVVTRYKSTSIDNSMSETDERTVFNTDSNGREFMKRILNTRGTWDYGSTNQSRISSQRIAGNYYPVNAAIYIEDNGRNHQYVSYDNHNFDTNNLDKAKNRNVSSSASGMSLCVLTDRSQGGSSLVKGSVELMVHRRTLHDDARGVGEPIDETVGGMGAYPPYGNAERNGDGIQVFGKHRIIVGSDVGGASAARKEMDSMFSSIHMWIGSQKRKDMHSPSSMNKSNEMQSVSDSPFSKTWFSAIPSGLPSNLMLVTFAKLPIAKAIDNSVLNNSMEVVYLVRVGHQYAVGESMEAEGMSKDVIVDMSSLFPNDLKIKKIVEKTLSNNKERGVWDATKIEWNSKTKFKLAQKGSSKCLKEESATDTLFVVQPMKICTFEVSLQSAVLEM